MFITVRFYLKNVLSLSKDTESYFMIDVIPSYVAIYGKLLNKTHKYVRRYLQILSRGPAPVKLVETDCLPIHQ